MSLTTLPTRPSPARITLKSVQPTMVSVTHSLRRQVRSRGGQRWGLTIDYGQRSRADLAPIIAFVLAQRGQWGAFDVVPTEFGLSQGGAGGAVTVSGAHAAGLRSVSITGLSGTLRAGDLVRFAGHAKVYMALLDRTGAGALSIEPGLIAPLAAGEGVTVNNVPMRCALAGDEHEWQLDPGSIITASLELVEVL